MEALPSSQVGEQLETQSLTFFHSQYTVRSWFHIRLINKVVLGSTVEFIHWGISTEPQLPSILQVSHLGENPAQRSTSELLLIRVSHTKLQLHLCSSASCLIRVVFPPPALFLLDPSGSTAPESCQLLHQEANHWIGYCFPSSISMRLYYLI